MSTLMKVIGGLATLWLVIVIPVYAILEPSRQEIRLAELEAHSVATSTIIYAENCAVCHGEAGQGIATMPALSRLSGMDAASLERTIARGVDNTVMAAWSVEEGGILMDTQISDMAVFIQQADWITVAQQVEAMGLTPPQVQPVKLSALDLENIAALLDGDTLSTGLTIYGVQCAACHGPDAGGTTLAPALNILAGTPADDIQQTIAYGVPSTLMAGWASTLSADEIDALIMLLLRWGELEGAGVEFPQTISPVLPSTPELIAEGDRLYDMACQSCHGTNAYGTQMAPALNNASFLAETPDDAIYQIVSGGVPSTLMPAWGGRLTQEQISALVAYLRSLEELAPPMANPAAVP